jgi:hypothetical protein
LLAWMRMVRLLTLSGLILLLAVPTASAGVREKILRECQEGRITGDYTPGQLRDARKNIPTDIDEYSDCRDVLARAALAGRGGGGAGGGGSVAPGGVQPSGADDLSYAANKAEQDELAKALSDAPEGTVVGGDRIVPGASGLAVDAARHGLPTTLLTVVILLGLCALAVATPAVRRRVLARRKS